MSNDVMIYANDLSKSFGSFRAVDKINFEVQRGEIVGFLGPNGAGKSTTMRILAGFLTASSGKARIDGKDVFWDPIEARRRIGYMPESCPLYTDMRVREYLRFRAGIKGLHGRKAAIACDYVMNRCWLSEVGRQLIGTLSKGYKQRVGLADALLADPPVLILDEPTAGLDPSQIRETRQLIRELGQRHTVLLSTHILPEVEMACDWVIIIHRGRVAASSSLRDLGRESGDGQILVADIEGQIDPGWHLYALEEPRGVVQSRRRLRLRRVIRPTCCRLKRVSPRCCPICYSSSRRDFLRGPQSSRCICRWRRA